MATRRIEQPVPACRAKMELLRWVENYLRQKAADISGSNQQEYGLTFTATVQDSWGSLEVLSTEEIPLPLAGDVTRIRLSLVCYEKDQDTYQTGQEYFTVSVIFADDPALATCQMRLTSDTAQTLVNGMWEDIRRQIDKYPVLGFVRRFRTSWLIPLLIAGVLTTVGSIPLFYGHEYTWAVSMAAAGVTALLYVYCSWRLPHCIFDTPHNDGMIDWNKWIWRAVFTSVVLAIAVRLALRLGFGL